MWGLNYPRPVVITGVAAVPFSWLHTCRICEDSHTGNFQFVGNENLRLPYNRP